MPRFSSRPKGRFKFNTNKKHRLTRTVGWVCAIGAVK